MKAVIFHCKEYETKIDKLANRPKDISPEELKEKQQNCKNCVVALLTVEKDDEIKNVPSNIAKEISNATKDFGEKKIVVLPFAHLSNNLANSELSLQIFDLIEKKLKKDFEVMRAHFGSHKSLLLDIFGHPGNARFREF